MLTITDSSAILAPEQEDKRALTVLLTVKNDGTEHHTESRLTVRIRDARGHTMAEMFLDGGPVSPGVQVLTFHTVLPAVAVASVEGELRCWRGTWVTPVTGIAPFQAPESDRSAPTLPRSAPAARQPPPWERFAVKRTAAPRPLVPEQPADGPWAKLDAGEIEAAMVQFDRHRLGEVGQHRLRELLVSSDPERLAWGCQISRLVRWVTPATMIPLLQHADPRVRREAVDSLGRVAGASVQGAVAPLLEDVDEGVREAAVVCMARISGKTPRW